MPGIFYQKVRVLVWCVRSNWIRTNALFVRHTCCIVVRARSFQNILAWTEGIMRTVQPYTLEFFQIGCNKGMLMGALYQCIWNEVQELCEVLRKKYKMSANEYDWDILFCPLSIKGIGRSESQDLACCLKWRWLHIYHQEKNKIAV